MSEEVACGVLYQQNLDKFVAGSKERFSAFTAGYICGQAEKVHLGTCSAAMFRVGEEHWQHVVKLVTGIAKRFNLRLMMYVSHVSGVREIWLLDGTPATLRFYRRMANVECDTPEYHLIRALLCGVSSHRVDLEYHQRPGYNEECDKVRPVDSSGKPL